MNYTYEKNDFELIADGEYEVIITDCGVKTLSTGSEKLAICYKIRDDVEQGFKGRLVFEDIWHEKENPQVFNRRRINQLLSTQEIKDGTTFENEEALSKFLVGKYLVVVVGKEFNDYLGKDLNRVKYYKDSKHKPQSIDDTSTAEIDPFVDDLPF